ncbi:hypothetical protein [Paenibacillus lautus]|uniref:hypothetical protein n=1 Tax=Paenibacillus lautus TaxID=1401 RepID=UPI003D2CAC5F
MRNPSFLLEYVSFAFTVYFSNLRSDMTSVKDHPIDLEDNLPEGKGQKPHVFLPENDNDKSGKDVKSPSYQCMKPFSLDH